MDCLHMLSLCVYTVTSITIVMFAGQVCPTPAPKDNKFIN